MPQISLRACEMPESPIRKLFPLAEAARAHAALDSGEVTGKLALRVES